MKYEAMILDGAGLTIWASGWHQGEEAWNNDGPAVDALTPHGAADAAAAQAIQCATLSLPFRGGEWVATATIRSRNGTGEEVAEGQFKVTLRVMVSSVEAKS